MNTIIFIATIAIGQVYLPKELDKHNYFLGELAVGKTMRVYSDALVVDPMGRAWLRGDFVASYSDSPFKRELEVTRSKYGFIVRVIPIYDGRIYRYPQYDRTRIPRYSDIPVTSLTVVPKPQPERSLFSEWDNNFSHGRSSSGPRRVTIGGSYSSGY